MTKEKVTQQIELLHGEQIAIHEDFLGQSETKSLFLAFMI